MFCPYCGKEVHTPFCTACGARMSIQPTPPPIAAPQTIYRLPTIQPKKKSFLKKWWWLIFVVIPLAVIAVLFCLLMLISFARHWIAFESPSGPPSSSSLVETQSDFDWIYDDYAGLRYQILPEWEKELDEESGFMRYAFDKGVVQVANRPVEESIPDGKKGVNDFLDGFFRADTMTEKSRELFTTQEGKAFARFEALAKLTDGSTVDIDGYVVAFDRSYSYVTIAIFDGYQEQHKALVDEFLLSIELSGGASESSGE